MNGRAMHFEYGMPYFNKAIDQCRILGARGGRISGRNRRARKACQQPAAPVTPVPEETAAEAIARLDAQFPWLRGAEHSTRRRPTA